MSSRTVTVYLLLAFLLVSNLFISQPVASQQPSIIDSENVRLYFQNEGGFHSLVYHDELEGRSYRTIVLEPDGNVTLSIQNVEDRFFNPEIEAYISLVTYTYSIEVDCILRFDGDGDGDFEYIIEYPESSFWGGGSTPQIRPLGSTGEPIDMTNGTIELYMWRADDRSDDLQLQVNREQCFVQIPFDLDTDGDGITDYSDVDNDGDGYWDEDDVFPLDPSEWRDSDKDGIGDNEDDDDNGNMIPDDLEIPLAMGIVLIPLVIIMAVMNKFKKKGNKEEEGEWGEEDIPILTTPHEGPKNW
jgi:hypothetical protein